MRYRSARDFAPVMKYRAATVVIERAIAEGLRECDRGQRGPHVGVSSRLIATA